VNWSERSSCAALGRCRQKEVATINSLVGPTEVRGLPLALLTERSVQH
jgi:hypothetical protein